MPNITITTIPEADDIVIDDVSMNDVAAFQSECLTDGVVICDWDTLHARLNNHDVSRFWWFLTEAERRSIAEMAIKNTLFYKLWYGRGGKVNCGGGEGNLERIVCTHNAIIRYVKFGTAHIGVDNCYYRRDENSDEFCYASDTPYNLPCYLACCFTYGSGFGHSLAAIQINEDVSKLESWIIFQYSSFDIKPGDPQLPTDRFPGNMYISIEDAIHLACAAYSSTEIARWEF